MILILDAPGAPHRALASFLGEDTVVRDDVDVTSMRAVREVVAELKPEVVVFAASTNDPVAALMDPERSFSLNAESVIGVAAAALEFQAQPVLLSTSAVFSGRGSFDEGDPVAPEGPWAESRHRAEVFMLRAHREALVLRFGPLIEHERFSKIPGEDLVRPLSMSQLGYVIRHATQRKLKGVLHVGSERKLRRSELRAELGLPAASAGEGAHTLLSIPRLEAEGLLPPAEEFKSPEAPEPAEEFKAPEAPEPAVELPPPENAVPPAVGNTSNLWADSDKMQAGLLELSRGQSEVLSPLARHLLVVTGKVVVEQQNQAEQIVGEGASLVVDGSDVQVLALAESRVVWAGPKC